MKICLVLLLLSGGLLTDLIMETSLSPTVRTISRHLSHCSLQTVLFDGVRVTKGKKEYSCSFTIVMEDEKVVEDAIQITCSKGPKKKILIEDLVLTSKTMKKFTLTFTIQKSQAILIRADVEAGGCLITNI